MRRRGKPSLGGAGAPTGFARTLPMKGRAVGSSGLATKSTTLAEQGFALRLDPTSESEDKQIRFASPEGRIRADSSERSESESKSLICGSRLIFLIDPHPTHSFPNWIKVTPRKCYLKNEGPRPGVEPGSKDPQS